MRRLLLLAGVLAAFTASPAFATKNCTIVTVPAALDFSPYLPSNPNPRTTTGTLQVRCNPNLTATVSMDRGLNAATYTPRYMRLGTTLLAYNVYIDGTSTSPIWGNGTAGTQVQTLLTTAQNKDFTLTIYGAMPPNGDIPPGTYTDTISVTVNDDKNGDPDTLTFPVRVVVTPECTIKTFAINFGNYDPVTAHATTPLDATTLIEVFCTPTTQGTVTLNAGLWSAGGSRRLRSAAGVFLNYDVFREVTHASIWNTVNTRVDTSTSRVVALGPGGFTAYARIPPNQDVPAGSYKDTLQATVNY